MPPALALLLSVFFALWLQRFLLPQSSERSFASWLPTLWLAILASRPPVSWFGGGASAAEGSSINLLVLFGLMLIGLGVLAGRRLNWVQVFLAHKAVFLFYLFFLLSTMWSPEPFLSFKRIIKDFGCVILALVVLTDANPVECMRAVYLRCACWLIPISVILCKYYPQYGRGYGRGGGQMYTGVTTQKNSLGEMAMLLSLFVVWSLLERRASDSQYRSTRQRLGFLVLFGIAAWLLYASESKTAQVAFLLGAGLLAVARSRAFHHRYRLFVSLALGLPAAGFLVMTASHLGASMADLLGRDATFTGRTAIWAVLKGAAINPVLGEGFCVFWETRGDQLMIDEFQTTIGSAHSGYWEVFIDGGILGLFALAFLVAKAAKAAIAQQRHGGAMTGVGMMVLLVVLLLNLSESYFARFGPSWFTFLLVSMAHPSVFNLTPPISVETSPPMIDRAEET